MGEALRRRNMAARKSRRGGGNSGTNRTSDTGAARRRSSSSSTTTRSPESAARIPNARIGGPETAGGPGGPFLGRFLDHCLRGTNAATGQKGTPLDLIAFHAKGQPKFVDGHVRMGISNQLRDIDRAFAVIAKYPEFKKTPIVIGESDPGRLRRLPGTATRLPQHARCIRVTPRRAFARKHDLAAKHGVNLEGALTWAFEFEDQPYFAGFRVLASNGIDLPVLNVFRMFSKMSGQRIAAESSGAVSLDAILKEGVRDAARRCRLASVDGKKLCILVWHYHDDDLPGPDAAVECTVSGLSFANGNARLQHFRIDAAHSNAFEVWKTLGSPQSPTPEQYSQIEKAGRLAAMHEPQPIEIRNAKATIRFALPRQGVSLLVIEQ